jgi:hypothetical protein
MKSRQNTFAAARRRNRFTTFWLPSKADRNAWWQRRRKPLAIVELRAASLRGRFSALIGFIEKIILILQHSP